MATSDGTTLWLWTMIPQIIQLLLIPLATPPPQAYATGGNTYTTTSGKQSQTLSSVADNQSFDITIQGTGSVYVFPQL